MRKVGAWPKARTSGEFRSRKRANRGRERASPTRIRLWGRTIPDEKETKAPDPDPASHEAARLVELTYELNPKHKDPWQADR